MWNHLRLLTALLYAQFCVGQITYGTVPVVDDDGSKRSAPTSGGDGVVLQQLPAAVNTAEHELVLEVSTAVNTANALKHDVTVTRDLQNTVICNLLVTFRIVPNPPDALFSSVTQVMIGFIISDPPTDVVVIFDRVVDFAANGEGTVIVPINDAILLDEARTGLCLGCTLTAEVEGCISGDCDSYNRLTSGTFRLVHAAVCGDPHMVGLLGQKIYWAGEDGGWYCLVSDGEDFQLNVRVTAPMPEEFPDRQLVSGVSLLLPNGHSLVVEVEDPYTIGTAGCADPTSPCLADGALLIMVDDEEASDLQIPAERKLVTEGVYMSATNLPAECRPFGGDRIWAAQFEHMTAAGRSLSAGSIPLDEWVLKPDTLAAPTWCAKYLEDGAPELLDTQTNHATLRIESPMIDLRINIGINHQELVLAADGSIVVPELEFWQTDIQLERHRFSDAVGGMLGDTSRFAFDSAGKPIREGLNALHGPVESYRVTGALGVVFDQLYHK